MFEQPVSRMVRPPVERETIRVGVIGTGFGAMVHVPGLREVPGIEVTAICSSKMSRAREVASEHGIPHTFDDYRDLLLSREVDAVTIAVPPNLHHPMVLAACEAGIHILCEKPLARTAAEARDMLRMAREAGVCHGVAFHRRYEPARKRMKELVDSGFIGDLHAASVLVYRSTLSPAERRYFSWLMERDKGGGVLAAVGSHYVDQLRWWFGEIHWVAGAVSTAVTHRPVRPSTRIEQDAAGQLPGERPTRIEREVDADDNATFVVRFASGALGNVAISYTAATDVGEELVVSGSEGMLAIQEPDQLVGTRHGGQIKAMLKHTTPLPVGNRRHIVPFIELARDWVGAMRSGEEASPSFEDGAKVQEVVDSVSRSQQLSRWIDLSGNKWPV